MYNFIILGLFFIEAESYVLLQVRKQDNNYSNVDALINKVVPSGQFHKIASKFGAKITDQKSETDLQKVEEGNQDVKNVADTETTVKLVQTDKPTFRSQNQYIKPKIINFKKSKPSVVFEVDTKAIVTTIKDLFSSKTFLNYMDKYARKAAIIYRAINKEIDKEYY